LSVSREPGPRDDAHRALEDFLDAAVEVGAARDAYENAEEPLSFLQAQALIDRRSTARKRESGAYVALLGAINRAKNIRPTPKGD
jgi:hypothetical protein